jgi:nitrous oxidase accessory protein NosD
MSIILTLLILAVASTHSIQPTRAATTIYVDDDNTTGPWNGTQAFPYRNITQALTAAQIGDSIFIKNGTYHEHVDINETLTVTGESTEGTIIDGDYQEFLPIVRIDKPNVLLTNLTVKKTSPSEETYGILIFRTQNVTLLNLNVRETYRAIMIINSYYCKVINNSITGNYASGISSLENCSYSLFTGNIIMENPIGISLESDSCRNNTFYHNTFVLNIVQASSQGTSTNWDNGYPSSGSVWYPVYGGNYWSNHVSTDTKWGKEQDIPGGDGIVDTAYVDNGVRDNYPLKNPWGKVPPIADFTYSPAMPTKNEKITFNATTSFDADGNITSYKWDFGDGNTTTVSNPTVIHSYPDLIDYTATLTITDDSGLKDTAAKTVQVRKRTSTLTIETHPTTMAIGNHTNINGTLTISGQQAPANTEIEIRYRLQGDITWQPLTNLTTDSTGKYEYDWTPASLGAYDLMAEYKGDEVTLPANSTTRLSVTKKTASLTIEVTPDPVTVLSDVTITGQITPARQETITIGFRPLYSPWKTIATVDTYPNGTYFFKWTTTNTGLSLFNATWQGDEITFAVTHVSGYVNINKRAGNVTASTDKTSGTTNSPIQITGKVTPTQTVANVTIQIRNGSQTLLVNATIQTDTSGSFNYTWTPSEGGTYTVRASWLGDDYTNPAQSRAFAIAIEQRPEYALWQYALVGALIAFAILAVIILRRRK